MDEEQISEEELSEAFEEFEEERRPKTAQEVRDLRREEAKERLNRVFGGD